MKKLTISGMEWNGTGSNFILMFYLVKAPLKFKVKEGNTVSLNSPPSSSRE